MEEFSILGRDAYGYPVRIYTAGICCHKNKLLLLKIDGSYPICPGDWEWLTCSISLEDASYSKPKLSENALNSLKLHTGLEGNILRTYDPLVWPDDEFRLTYLLYPILIKVHSPCVHLWRQKFSEYEWVACEDILNFDRNNYFSSYFIHFRKEIGNGRSRQSR